MQLSIGDELVDALKLAYEAKRPVVLMGPTGAGKSQIAERAAKEMDIGFIARDLSLMEAPDLAGMPTIINGELSYAIPKFLPKDGSGIIVFEELNR
ncbi:MAG: ATPase, partial [Planctomycetota bacterium]